MIYFNFFMIPISTYLFLTSADGFSKFLNGLAVVLCVLAVALHIATY